jgi:hypothetical protein
MRARRLRAAKPVTRWVRTIESAKRAVKSGAEGVEIAASPESMYLLAPGDEEERHRRVISASSASGRA